MAPGSQPNNAEAIVQHLARRLPGFVATQPPKRLTGGLLNHLWRVLGEPRSVVVKVAPPWVATQPEVPLDAERIRFEARALEALAHHGTLSGVCTGTAGVPELLDFDATRRVIIMEDLTPCSALADRLATACPTTAADALGSFIGRLHRCSLGDSRLAPMFFNAAIQRARLDTQYAAVSEWLQRAGVADAERLGARAIELGRRLCQPGRCLVMGDLWPPSVLIGHAEAVRLIDWEFVTFGNPAQDLAHLAAHLQMLVHCSAAAGEHGRMFWRHFVGAYRTSLGSAGGHILDAQVRADCAVHFAAEVLTRAVGAFRDSSPYATLPADGPAVRNAVRLAVEQLRGTSESWFLKQLFA